MASYIKQLTQNGDDIYPITRTEAVYGDDGSSISEYIKSNLPNTKAITLSASSWTGTATPYQYDLGTDYTGKSVIIGYNATKYSDDSYNAAQDAQIQGGDGTTIYAMGDKPAVDIPAVIQFS